MSRLVTALCVTILATATAASSAPIFMGLGDLPGGDSASLPEAVSADGSMIVGRGITGLGAEAYRWTEAEGMVGLGDLFPDEGGSSPAHAPVESS